MTNQERAERFAEHAVEVRGGGVEPFVDTKGEAETAWLIEWPSHINAGVLLPASYWWGPKTGFGDHSCAIRFARQIDAQRMIRHLHPSMPVDVRAVEHRWLDLPRKENSNGDRKSQKSGERRD